MQCKYIKSPLNYVGGKFKLLDSIVPLFPQDIDTFVDLFGGGFNVGINVKAQRIIYNDSCTQVADLLRNLSMESYADTHQKILDMINRYGLSRSDIHGYDYYGCNTNDGLGDYNKLNYYKLREDYNTSPDWVRFYTLITYAFNNQIRFNAQGGFNMPCGKRDYNKSLQDKLQAFVQALHQKEIVFYNNDFTSYVPCVTDFVYLDPPYYNSVSTYNEQGGWTAKNEQDLYATLDNINEIGAKFALSNNLKYDNPFLNEWKDKYNVHYLNADYSNCNYHQKDKSKGIEVLITNY